MLLPRTRVNNAAPCHSPAVNCALAFGTKGGRLPRPPGKCCTRVKANMKAGDGIKASLQGLQVASAEADAALSLSTVLLPLLISLSLCLSHPLLRVLLGKPCHY